MAQPNKTYGSITHATENGGPSSSADPERASVDSKPDDDSATTTLVQRVRRHMTRPVSREYGDVALLACYPITGLLDSSAVYIWGSFLSMQTGNTIYLGLGVVAPSDGNRWIRALISITCFCLGSMFFAFYHRRLGGRTRWVLVSSYFLQWLLIVTAALMVTLGPATGTTGPVTVWIGLPIALVAFNAGGQAFASRVLKFPALTSVVLTSIYCDLFSDPNLFAGPTANIERNRRAAAPLLLLIGAMIGGVWAHSSIGLAGALWTAVVLKACIIVAWCCWKADKEESQP